MILTKIAQSWLLWSQFVASVLFIIWGFCFIQHSAIVLNDGNRYYHLADDAMISMRYAWNLAHGQGLTWNTKYPPVEGYSNPLMVFVMSAIIIIFQDPSLSCLGVQLLGMIFVLLTAFLVAQLTQQLLTSYSQHRIASEFFVFLTFFLTLTAYPLLYYSLMGMENGLLAVLLTFTLYILFQESQQNTKFWKVPILLALIMLTRPDAIILVFPLALFYGYEQRKISRWTQISSLFIFIAPVLFWFLFRWLYYTQWIPNTALLKLDVSFYLRWKHGLEYTQKTLYILGLGPCIFLLLSILGRPNRRKMLLFSLFPILLLYQIWSGGDAFQIQRFSSHYWGIFFVLFSIALSEGVHFVESRVKKKNSIVLAFLLVLILGFLGWSFRISFFSLANLFISKPFHYAYSRWEEEILSHHKTNLKISLALKDAKKSQELSFGVIWAGMTYYADVNGVDYLGKCDRYIASLPPNFGGFSPGHSKYDFFWSTSYYLPDVIYVNGNEMRRVFQQYPELAHQYQDFQLFFLKKHSPHLDANKFLERVVFY